MDKSLGDIISETRKSSQGGGGGGGGGRGRGGRASRGRGAGGRASRGRGGPQGSSAGYERAAPYIRRVVADDDYEYDHQEPEPSKFKVAPASVSLHTGSKLFVSNLDHEVIQQDIEEVYGKFGVLRKASVHYDKNGQSLGTAEIVYQQRQSAVQAIKEYQGISLDGKPMMIELISKVPETPAAAPQQQQQQQRPRRVDHGSDWSALGSGPNYDSNPRERRDNNAPVYVQQRRPNPSSIRPRGGNGDRQTRNTRGGANGDRSARGAGKGSAGRNKEPEKSTEDLDAEMDAYMNQKKAAVVE